MATRPIAANQADFRFRLADFPDADLQVASFDGHEGLSQLYSFQLELVSTSFEFQPEELLGTEATLTLADGDQPRQIHGIIWQFAKQGEGHNQLHYQAELVPVHRLLTKRFQSRVFEPARCEDMTVPGIIRHVFKEAGIPDERVHIATQNEYPRPDFVAQYRESDWDFISRLMEREGIHYFFEHTADGYRMAISDQTASFRPAEDLELPFRPPNGLVPENDCAYAVELRRDTSHGSVSLDDYTFRDPSLNLQATVEAGEQTALLHSDYPGNFELKTEAQRYAAIRMQEYLTRRERVSLDATTRGLQPGTCFRLVEHPDLALNRDYLVTYLRHTGSQNQSGEVDVVEGNAARYDISAEVISTEVRFRPPSNTPVPNVGGSQTALVVGPESEEIHTDEYGRVRVQFHWDQTGTFAEGSSAWIRVSHGMAGGGYGMFFLPRVGQEVIVDFLEGNPDRPIITGRVYNKDHMPPYQLPVHKNRSTIKTRTTKGGGGSNELRFDDTKGEEQVLLHAQHDLHLRAGNDRRENIGQDRHLIVKRDQLEAVERSVHRKVGQHRSEHVVGDENTRVDGSMAVQVGGTQSLTVSGDVVQQLTANYKKTVGGTAALSADKVVLEATSTLELKCGGSSIVLTPGAIFINGGPVVHINSGPGPAVALPTATPAEPGAPTEPQPADEVEHGTDTRYGAGGAVQQPQVTPPAEQMPEEPEESWIEIELVDEDEQPVPSARFEVRTPSGEVRSGRTNANGVARVAGIQPGTCEICFPDLDAECWERI